MSVIANLLSEAVNPIDDDRYWQPAGGIFGSPGYYGNYDQPSGEVVNEKTALLVSTHFSCIRCKSEDIAKLPVVIAERIDNDSREIRDDDPAFGILNVEYNPEMNSFVGCSTLLAHAIGFKRGIAEIERDGGGKPLALWPLDPTRVTKKRIGGRIFHEVRVDFGEPYMLPDEDAFEIIGPSFDGQIGYSLAEVMKFIIGAELAAQNYQNAFFGNGAWLGGVIQNLPPAMTKQAREEYMSSFAQRHQGARRAHGLAVLPVGEYKEASVEPRKAQLEQLLKYDDVAICGVHRVPPPKVQIHDNSHFNNIEQLNIAYVGEALMPLGLNYELEIKRKLLGGKSSTLYARLNYNAMLRADYESRQRGYAIGRMWGTYTINEVRKMEDLDPIDGPEGDTRLIPANMIDSKQASEPRDQQSTNAPPPKEKQDQAALRESYLSLVLDGLNRAAQKESKRVKFLESKDRNGDVNAFYQEHKSYVASCVLPALRSMAMFVGDVRINDDRLCVVTELFTSEWATVRPAANGAPDAAWMHSFATRWIDAVLTAVTEE